MKRLLILMLLLVAFSGWAHNLVRETKTTKKYPQEIEYVMHPNPKDTLCRSEVVRAQKDVAKGKIVFSQPVGSLTGEIRYEEELQFLCKQYRMEYGHEVWSDCVSDNETQGCYGSYMDKVIIDKYGIGFKKKLVRQADSLFLVHVQFGEKVVKYWNCDERPKLPKESKRTDDLIISLVVSNLDIKKKEGEYGGWPFMDIGFVVELNGKLSTFYSGYFAPQLTTNAKFKDQLCLLAVDYIKKHYPVWVPGKIKGIPVRTYNNVRVFFEKRR